MAYISENFKKDTKGSSISVSPVVVIADLVDDNYEVIDVFSTGIYRLKNSVSNDYIESKEILKNVSSIKNTLDYERKSLRINTFRFTLYDYYDVTGKLSNSPFFNEIKSFIGKNVILYYKTQTTDRLNLYKNTDDREDYDLPIIYKGIISRVSQSSDSISIQAEDFTQQYISDKEIPKTKISDLSDDITRNILDKELDDAVPLVIGKVDKAPVVKYKTNFQSETGLGSLGLIHDSRAIYNNFSTSNVKEYSYWYLYFKDDDDYVTFEYPTTFNYYEGKSFFVDTQTYAEAGLSILPEVQEEQVSSIYLKGHTFPTKVLADFSGDTSVGNINGFIDEDMLVPNLNWIFTNVNKQWKRQEDYQGAGSVGIQFSGVVTYEGASDFGKGRWMVVSFDKSKKIFSVKSMSSATQSEMDYSTNTNTGEVNMYIKPFNKEQWKEFLLGDVTLQVSFIEELLNDDLINNKEFPNVGFSSITLLPEIPPSEQIKEKFLFKESDINGLTYGPIIKKSYDETIETDKLILFEQFNHIGNPGATTAGYWIGPMVASYYKEINQFEGEDIFASVAGRHDYSSTESIDQLPSLFEGVEVSLSFALYGSDNTIPDLANLIGYLDNDLLEYTEQYLFKPFLLPDTPSFGYTQLQEMTGTFSDNAGFPLSSLNVLNTIILGLYSKMYMNILDKEIQDLGNLNFQVTGGGSFGDVIAGFYINVIKHVYETQYGMNFDWGANPEQDGWEGWHSFVLGGPMNNSSGQDVYGGEIYAWNPPNDLYEDTTSQYEPHRRLLLKRILEYMYQTNIELDNVADITGFTQNWDDYNIDLQSTTAINDYVDNMDVYFDDTINTINKAIFDLESTTENVGPNGECDKRFELYVWNDTPYYYGQSHPYYIQLYQFINPASFIFEIESQGTTGSQFNTTGFIEKPVDIFINLLSRELDFGVNDNILDTGMFDVENINSARNFYSDWKMGFAIDDFTDAKKLLEDISKETPSFIHFNEEGRFSLINVADYYVWDDVDRQIDVNDIISYKFSRTKIEDVITSLKCHYRYDNGNDTYLKESFNNLYFLEENDFFEYYNINSETGHKELNLRYHTDGNTVSQFAWSHLSKHCNQHLLVDIELPLSYILDVGNIVYLPLINNTKAFGIDYSQVETLNGQYLYPAFMVMSRDLGMDKAKYKLMQLHHTLIPNVPMDFQVLEEQPVEIFGNFKEFNTNDSRLHNWNYNPFEGANPINTYTQIDEEIPYGDVNGDGVIDVADIVMLVESIIGDRELNVSQKERIQNYNLPTFTKTDYPEPINVSKIVGIVDYILN